MAYGIPPKNTHTMPSGRRAFASDAVGENVTPRAEVVRPGQHADGSERMGTPSEHVHDGSATRKGYADPAGQKYREALRPAPYSTNNAEVHSKNVRRYGKDGSKGNFPHSSTGEQPASLYRSGPASSALAAASRGGPANVVPETVGHVPNSGGKFKHASHSNASMGLHGGMHAPTIPVNHSGARAPDTLPRSSDLRSEIKTDSP